MTVTLWDTETLRNLLYPNGTELSTRMEVQGGFGFTRSFWEQITRDRLTVKRDLERARTVLTIADDDMSRSFRILEEEAWATASFAVRSIDRINKYSIEPATETSRLWVVCEGEYGYSERVCLEHGIDSFVSLFLQNVSALTGTLSRHPDGDWIPNCRALTESVFWDLTHRPLQIKECCRLPHPDDTPRPGVFMNSAQMDALWCAYCYLTLAVLALHTHSCGPYQLFLDQFRRLWLRVERLLETGEDAPELAKK